jgi:hypothetical protein
MTALGFGPGQDPGTELRDAECAGLALMAGRGELTVPIAATYPLDDVVAAHKHLIEATPTARSSSCPETRRARSARISPHRSPGRRRQPRGREYAAAAAKSDGARRRRTMPRSAGSASRTNSSSCCTHSASATPVRHRSRRSLSAAASSVHSHGAVCSATHQPGPTFRGVVAERSLFVVPPWYHRNCGNEPAAFRRGRVGVASEG